ALGAHIIHQADMLDALSVHPQVLQRLPIRPIAYTVLGSTNNRLCRLGHTNERGPPTFVSHCTNRTPHIDIYPVKAQLTANVGGLIEVLWPASKDLSYNGTLGGSIEKDAKDAVTAAPEPFNVGKLGQNYIGASIKAMHGTVRCIRNAIHWGQC